MAVQNLQNINTEPFILGGDARKKSVTFAQDAGRGSDVARFTLMAKYVSGASVGKWTTFTDETATDGTQWPAGIAIYAIDQADIVAGDVTDVVIYYLGNPATVDEGQLVIENSKTLATEITSPAGIDKNVRDCMEKDLKLIPKSSVSVDDYENA
jgi:hypothetical protein